jgi:hypothetical protein
LDVRLIHSTRTTDWNIKPLIIISTWKLNKEVKAARKGKANGKANGKAKEEFKGYVKVHLSNQGLTFVAIGTLVLLINVRNQGIVECDRWNGR